MIILCQAPNCGHEWQAVKNDSPCAWCGGPGKSIGSDYMSDVDGSTGPTVEDDDDAELSLEVLIGTSESMPIRVR